MATITEWDDDLVWDDSAVWFEWLIVDPLLPATCTAAEYAMEQSTARLAAMGAPIRPLWNPDTCPAALLPWLAWALGVDEWDANWTEEAKRATIRASVEVHRHKGTVASIRKALTNAGYGDAQIIEREPTLFYGGTALHDGSEIYGSTDHWAEYTVILSRPITIAQADKVRGILAAIAPLRCHLKALDYQVAAHLYNAEIRYDGSYTHGVA